MYLINVGEFADTILEKRYMCNNLKEAKELFLKINKDKIEQRRKRHNIIDEYFIIYGSTPHCEHWRYIMVDEFSFSWEPEKKIKLETYIEAFDNYDYLKLIESEE